jgi:hypothetical protein
MASTAKAIAIARNLIDLWTKEVATTLPIIVETFDTDGNPVITLSADTTPAFSEKVIVVRVKPIDWTATDVIGHTSQIFTPHVIQIATETDATTDILTPVELLPVLAEIAKTGCMVEWYQETNGTVPTVAVTMVAAKLTKKYSDLYWTVQKAQ